MRSRRPNILWYCTDQQRFDTIRALGNPHIITHKHHVVAEFHDALGSTARPMASHYVAYHSEGLGELFDLADDPGEFDNLWDTANPALRYDLLRRHFDAMMATSDAGPQRVSMY